MSTFDEILQRQLKIKGNSVKGVTSTSLVNKGLDLKGTFEVRMEDDVDSENLEQQAADAALARVEQILEGVISGDMLDSRISNKTFTHKGDIKAQGSISGLRDAKGRFLSATNLARIVNISLYKYVKDEMGSPALNWRTGRFAHSAHINSLTLANKVGTQRKNRGSVFFSYMLYPYAVFEKDSNRDPRITIREAISKALRDALSPQSFNTTIFKIQKGGT